MVVALCLGLGRHLVLSLGPINPVEVVEDVNPDLGLSGLAGLNSLTDVTLDQLAGGGALCLGSGPPEQE